MPIQSSELYFQLTFPELDTIDQGCTTRFIIFRCPLSRLGNINGSCSKRIRKRGKYRVLNSIGTVVFGIGKISSPDIRREARLSRGSSLALFRIRLDSSITTLGVDVTTACAVFSRSSGGIVMRASQIRSSEVRNTDFATGIRLEARTALYI